MSILVVVDERSKKTEKKNNASESMFVRKNEVVSGKRNQPLKGELRY